jgi:hypothetical protein
MLEDSLQKGDEVLSNGAVGLSHAGEKPVAQTGLLVIGYKFLICVLFGSYPCPVDPILDENGGWEGVKN